MQVPECQRPLTSGAGYRVARKSRILQLGWQAALLITTLLCFLSSPLQAQYNASLSGTIADPSGAVISGATVILRDLATNKTLTTTTNPAGTYVFNQLPPSHFELIVKQKGFETKVLPDIGIVPEQPNTHDVRLQIGSEAQTVTVSGDQVPLLDTSTASTSGTISSQEIQHLPSFGRDPFQLAELAPGAFGNGAQAAGGGAASLPGSNKGSTGAAGGIFTTENAPQIVANGGQNENNGISIDGISTVSAVWGGSSVITPSEDSIQDVKVITNSYDASNGRFSSAQIQVISKAGSNQVHGSAFLLGYRPGLNAYQAWNGPGTFNAGTPGERGLTKDTQRYNQFGGSIGGPFWKNHLFGFFNYETLRNNTTTTSVGWYDTPQFDALAPAGSIASTFLTFPGAGVSNVGQVAVSCGQIGLVEGVNCRTVNGGLNIGSPLTTPLHTQDLTYSSSTNPGVGNGLSTTPDIAEYTTADPNQTTDAQYNGRLDAYLGAKDRATFTIYWVPETQNFYNGPVRPYNQWHHSSINDAFAGIWDHTFSPTLLNEARANAAGWRWNEINSNPQEPFGLPQDNIDQIGSLNGSSPNTTFNYFGAPGPSVFNQWTYSYDDVLTKVAGNHNIKVGAGLTRLEYLSEAPYSARPGYTFYNIWDFLNDAPEAEYGTFDPLTGAPTINRQDDREDLWDAFVQDDWKVTPRLTLNLGLRWSYFGPLASKENNLSTVVLGNGSALLTDLHLRLGGDLYNSQKGNFGPQVGFAWTPPNAAGRVVFHGGFGLNYNQEEIAIAANGLNNVPLVVNSSLSSTSPSQINPDIVYAVPSNAHSLLGYPPNPNVTVSYNSAHLPTAGTVSVTAFPANIPTQYTYHYSLDMQTQFGKDWVGTLGYQGSTGRHLITQENLNVVADALHIPFNPAVNVVDYFNNEGNSNYNALLATLRHQFSRSYMVEGQYTWSKSLDDGSQPYYEDPYPWNPRLAWGRSDYNVTDAFRLFGLWQPDFFHNQHGWLAKTAGGWSLSGILNLDTGFPWTPTYYGVTNGLLYYNGSGYSTLRPAAYRGGAGHNTSNSALEEGRPNVNFPNGGLAYFTIPTYTPVTAPFPAQFAAPPAPGVARNSFNGPNYRDVDATLTKDFGLPNTRVLGDNALLTLRVDAFNLFNTVNLNSASIDTNIQDATVGQATGALSARIIDLQARFSF
jgi:Carboxypeptidase regulatory-like domain